jgi:hypothetical protein
MQATAAVKAVPVKPQNQIIQPQTALAQTGLPQTALAQAQAKLAAAKTAQAKLAAAKTAQAKLAARTEENTGSGATQLKFKTRG